MAYHTPRNCPLCPRIITTRRARLCDVCRAQNARDGRRIRGSATYRGSSTEQGYGAAHQRLRAALKPLVEAGGVNCARCGLPIHPAEPWDLGHNDFDRSLYAGPEHRACNRATHGRKKPTHSRRW